MSQINNYLAGGGPGGGTVTSVSGGVGINITGTPTVNPTVNLDIPVTIPHGGTNATSFATTNGVIYFDGTRLVSTAVGTAGQVLKSNGVGFPPTFQNGGTGTVTSVTAGTGITVTGTPTINPTVSLTVPVAIANGGTNATSMANTDGVVYFDGTRLSTTTVGTAGQILTSNGAGMAPTFQAAPSSGASTFHTDSGDATVSAGAITIAGTHGINTSGTGSTVTVAINNAITLGDLSSIIGSAALTATTGDVTLFAGNLNMPDTSASGLEGIITFNNLAYISNFGDRNIFVGRASGNTSNTGSNNAGLGLGVLSALTGGDDNTACGALALTNVTGGSLNTAIGSAALTELVSGSSNTAVGEDCLSSNISSSTNTALGSSALTSLTSGAGSNIAIGGVALEHLVNGIENISIGTGSGENYVSNESNNILIGNDGVVGDNDTIRIGDVTNSSCYIEGIAGVTTSNSQMVTIDSTNGQLGSATLPTSFAWNVITADTGMAINNGYIANKAGTAVLTLPATAAVGSVIRVTGINTALGWQIAQNSGQTIHFGAVDTTTGTGGSLSSTLTRDSIELVCVVANTDWNVLSSIGNITYV